MFNEAELAGIVETQVAAMPHRCTIMRDDAMGENAYGGRAKPEWHVVVSDEPCRLVTQERVTYGLQRNERVESLVVSGYLLLLSPDVDVREADQAVLGSDTYRVMSVTAEQTWRGGLRQAHVERVA